MHENLKTVLHRRNITLKQYVDFIGVSEKTVWNKLKGNNDFTVPEFKKTCVLLPKFNADYLFSQEIST